MSTPRVACEIRQKPEETPVTLAAKSSELGRVYLDWAKYPVVETEPIESGYIVRFRDLRYDYPGPARAGTFWARAWSWIGSLKVVRESFGSRGRGRGRLGRSSRISMRLRAASRKPLSHTNGTTPDA